MPAASETCTVAMPPGELWELVRNPDHLPRWWPRVERVEGVQERRFTQVLRSSSGKLVRADYEVTVRDDAKMRFIWALQVGGTPFARVLSASEIEVKVQPRMGLAQSAGSDVTLTLTQTPHAWLPAVNAGPSGALALLDGLFARLGSPMIRRAAGRTVKEALDGLQRIAG